MKQEPLLHVKVCQGVNTRSLKQKHQQEREYSRKRWLSIHKNAQIVRKLEVLHFIKVVQKRVEGFCIQLYYKIVEQRILDCISGTERGCEIVVLAKNCIIDRYHSNMSNNQPMRIAQSLSKNTHLSLSLYVEMRKMM